MNRLILMRSMKILSRRLTYAIPRNFFIAPLFAALLSACGPAYALDANYSGPASAATQAPAALIAQKLLLSAQVQLPDSFSQCDTQVRARCDAYGTPAQVVPICGQFLQPCPTYPNSSPPYPLGETDIPYDPGETFFVYNCLYTNPNYPGTLNYYAGLVGACGYRTGPLLNLKIESISAPSLPVDDLGYPIAKPGKTVQVDVQISGIGLSSPENRTTDVLLKAGSVVLDQYFPLSSLANGNTVLHFQVTPTIADVGPQNWSVTVDPANSLGEIDRSDNTLTGKAEVRCDTADYGNVVPYFPQYGMDYSPKPYGPLGTVANGQTIRKFGCYLSDVAMVMYAYGITKTISGTDLDPGSLNDAVRAATYKGANPMMTMGGGVIGEGMAAYGKKAYAANCPGVGDPNRSSCIAKANSIISFEGVLNYNQNETTNLICGKGTPVILRLFVPEDKVSNKEAHNHFVVATGTRLDSRGNLTYQVQDPGAEDGEDRPLKLVQGSYINGMRPYVKVGDPSMMFIEATNSVDYVLTDPLGRRIGANPTTGETFNEVEGDTYYTDFVPNEDPTSTDPDLPSIVMLQHTSDVVDGEYTLDVYAKKAGPYSLIIHSYDVNGIENDVKSISASPATAGHFSYQLNHSSNETVDGKLSIFRKVVLDPKKNDGAQLLITGNLKAKNGQLTFKRSFEISIDDYFTAIDFKDFKTVQTPLGIRYLYDQKNGNAKVEVDEDGNFTAYLRKIDLGRLGKKAKLNLNVQIDDVAGAGDILLRCLGPICF